VIVAVCRIRASSRTKEETSQTSHNFGTGK
jgi:hypothetical protein